MEAGYVEAPVVDGVVVRWRELAMHALCLVLVGDCGCKSYSMDLVVEPRDCLENSEAAVSALDG